ncbi:MAG: hypothetical protein HC817_12985 [Saprospiraceae bacterium]|nr:hypothetical protein [Saprospiraceae bacterium]
MAELEAENTNSAPLSQKKPEKKGKKRSIVARVFRATRRLFLSAIFIFIVLALIVQLQPVQDWTIQKVTSRLSEELKTTVRIDQFSLDFFDELSLKGVFIGNQNAPNDTLISVEKLRLDVSYWHLIFGITQLDALRIEKATVRLNRFAGQYDNNLQFIINYFDPPREGPPQPENRLPIFGSGKFTSAILIFKQRFRAR